MPKTIQEELGDRFIAAFRDVASHEIYDVSYWCNELAHMASGHLKQTVAETIYGARWLYKLGLVFLTRDDEQNAHVRAQISEYSAAIEAILTEMIVYAHDNSRLTGVQYGVDFKGQPVRWSHHSGKHSVIAKLSFAWIIKVAHEESIITSHLHRELTWLRLRRNEIHLAARSRYAFTPTSKRAYNALLNTIKSTRVWKPAP